MTIDANTRLLLDFNGGDGSTIFTDTGVDVHSITPIDNAVQKIDQFKFSSGTSGLFDGAGDRLEVANHSVFDFLTNNNNPFTICPDGCSISRN